MIIFRRLSQELYRTLSTITLILLMIFITHQFIHYWQEAAAGQLTVTAVMHIMSLQIPLLLGYLLPLAFYLSLLLVLGRLYTEHEMTVLFSSGFSPRQLTGMVLFIGCLVTLLVAALMLWIEPRMQVYRTQVLVNALNTMSIKTISPKRFQQGPNHYIFYADHSLPQEQGLGTVFLAKYSPESKQWDIISAEAAKEPFIPALKDRFIVFQNGHRYLGVPGQRDFQLTQFDQYGLRRKPLTVAVDNWPNTLSTGQLWQALRTEHQVERYRALQATWQWRLAMPISVLLFTLLALPLSASKPRSSRIAGARLLPAILIYIIYADLMFLGRAWIEKGAINANLGLWWIHGMTLLLAMILNIRATTWQRLFTLIR